MKKINHKLIISIGVLLVIGDMLLHINQTPYLFFNPWYIIVIGLDIFYLKKSNNLVIIEYHAYKIGKL